MKQGFLLVKKFASGGFVVQHRMVDKDKSDYNDIKTIALRFAEMGHKVYIAPIVHYKSEEYKCVFGRLIGTKFERKCPDLIVDELFYEYEDYVRPWKKRKIKNMLTHGVNQSTRLVLNNNKGCVDRIIRNSIIRKCALDKGCISEVWIYEKGKIRLFYKDGRFYKTTGRTEVLPVTPVP